MRFAAVIIAMLLAPVVQAQEFRPLEWRAYGATGLTPNWRVSGGDIAHMPGGGDLISVETFRNFELAFEWRLAAGGNSGIMYRVVESAGASYASGPEYQILDNGGHADGNSPLTSAASAYALYGPAEDVTRPVGEWNSGRIVVDGNKVEHWLNDVKVVAYELGSDEWRARVAASKFAGWPDYGMAAEGHISLQDHGSVVHYRNVRIKVLAD